MGEEEKSERKSVSGRDDDKGQSSRRFHDGPELREDFTRQRRQWEVTRQINTFKLPPCDFLSLRHKAPLLIVAAAFVRRGEKLFKQQEQLLHQTPDQLNNSFPAAADHNPQYNKLSSSSSSSSSSP
ncbi:unnamed protein product [Pleuronectes platessa]|uniref:Uncharacterized protein n=1 Tax=Pleuronectes platessa TaxID=8262 RepID=A0A9N7U0G4_PLEPL|nr:unnamed protein product [Pleuronectes platessa]